MSYLNRNVVIIGAGGHGKVIADIILCAGDRVVGFLDDKLMNELYLGYPLLGKQKDYEKFADAEFVIAIGNAKTRERIARSMPGVKWYTAVHPNAVISSIETTVGEGTVVMAGAVINPGTQVGKHCIVNTGAIVEHDNRISDYVHISVGARLAGTVSIGMYTWVGIGAVVSNNVSICGNCVIGAGGVVVRDITEQGTYVGVPVRRAH